MSSDDLIEPVRQHLAELGFELVDLRRSGSPQRPSLQLRIDLPDSTPGHGVTADDCARVSRSLERFLEARGVVGPRYVLQVSSPGFDRPVRWPEHWRRFIGRRVRLRGPLPGHPEAEILEVPDDGHVRLRLADGSEPVVPLAAIREATLVVEWGKGKNKE